jgi:hypothetical protein
MTNEAVLYESEGEHDEDAVAVNCNVFGRQDKI